MSTTAPISVEEYLKLSCKPACEYIDGVLRQKSLPATDHGMLQLRLGLILNRLGYQAYPEIHVRISETKWLIPDVTVDDRLERPYPTKAVPLVVEILSPDDRLGATLAKCEEYHAWGTPYCWVVDPEKQAAWEYHKGGEPVRVESQGTLRAGEIEVSMPELFA
ncbi:MAG TPA: Uma2 family endonuclease [Bryobacteraceae bacterium]|jgi:Uma2 family endonuclease|nr:Uma2 family endonuclease [Bryobacteraceae bacterium]